MLVLDENLPHAQRQLLRKWGFRFRAIGVEVESHGTRDENLLPALRRLGHPTFFSLDQHFYRPDWAHQKFCLVWMDTRPGRAADFIRAFLKHPAFDTQAKRMDLVARLHPDGIQFWRAGSKSSHLIHW